MKRVEDLVPKDKFDFSGMDELAKLSDEEIEPILPALLEWMKDMNWPVARDMPVLLAKHQGVIVPYLMEILRPEQVEDDWKYYIVNNLLPLLEPEYLIRLQPCLERMADRPTSGERAEEADVVARELLLNYRKTKYT